MTVRSSPSSKHIPRKERRYHVKKQTYAKTYVCMKYGQQISITKVLNGSLRATLHNTLMACLRWKDMRGVSLLALTNTISYTPTGCCNALRFIQTATQHITENILTGMIRIQNKCTENIGSNNYCNVRTKCDVTVQATCRSGQRPAAGSQSSGSIKCREFYELFQRGTAARSSSACCNNFSLRWKITLGHPGESCKSLIYVLNLLYMNCTFQEKKTTNFSSCFRSKIKRVPNGKLQNKEVCMSVCVCVW